MMRNFLGSSLSGGREQKEAMSSIVIHDKLSLDSIDDANFCPWLKAGTSTLEGTKLQRGGKAKKYLHRIEYIQNILCKLSRSIEGCTGEPKLLFGKI